MPMTVAYCHAIIVLLLHASLAVNALQQSSLKTYHYSTDLEDEEEEMLQDAALQVGLVDEILRHMIKSVKVALQF